MAEQHFMRFFIFDQIHLCRAPCRYNRGHCCDCRSPEGHPELVRMVEEEKERRKASVYHKKLVVKL